MALLSQEVYTTDVLVPLVQQMAKLEFEVRAGKSMFWNKEGHRMFEVKEKREREGEA